MNKKIHAQSGSTLTSVVVGVALSATVIFFGMNLFSTLGKSQNQQRDRGEFTDELGLLLSQVMQTGRLATICTKVVSEPSALSLKCSVDYNIPPTGVTTEVRFYKNSNEKSLHYQQWNAGTGQWEDKLVYGKSGEISNFVLCDHTDMQLANPTCTLLPNDLYTPFALLPTASQKRFFRFQITGTDKSNNYPLSFQSAFYVRNPTHIVPAGSLVYQWK